MLLEPVKQISICIYHWILEPYVFFLTYIGSELPSGVMGILCSFPSTTITMGTNSPSAATTLVESRGSFIAGWVPKDGASSIGPATSRNTHIMFFYNENGGLGSSVVACLPCGYRVTSSCLKPNNYLVAVSWYPTKAVSVLPKGFWNIQNTKHNNNNNIKRRVKCKAPRGHLGHSCDEAVPRGSSVWPDALSLSLL